MDIGTLLGMTFMLFSGTQPDWTDIAQKLIPASKAEILAEVRKNDERCMEGDSVRVLYDLDPKEYSYTNDYEFTQALNKHRGGYSGSISESMVDSVLPMVYIRINIKEEAENSYFNIPERNHVRLWHPEGITVTWAYNNANSKIGWGYKEAFPEKVAFVNKFLNEPYVFIITDTRDGLKGFKGIGVLRDGKMVVYDIDGGRYDGIEDMIQKKYGSIKGYIEEVTKPRHYYFDETSKLLFELKENGDTINVHSGAKK